MPEIAAYSRRYADFSDIRQCPMKGRDRSLRLFAQVIDTGRETVRFQTAGGRGGRDRGMEERKNRISNLLITQ